MEYAYTYTYTYRNLREDRGEYTVIISAITSMITITMCYYIILVIISITSITYYYYYYIITVSLLVVVLLCTETQQIHGRRSGDDTDCYAM